MPFAIDVDPVALRETAQLFGIGIAAAALVLFVIARRDARPSARLAVQLGQP